MAELSFNVHLDQPFDQAVETVTEALKGEGFGVLTRVDVHAAFKEKLGKEFREYAILGACNPPLAHKALNHRAEVGLMLPCNVTVEAEPAGGSTVRIGDPEGLMEKTGFSLDPVLREVGEEARQRLKRVAESLSAAVAAE
ncbi:MAG: DUF302 domain-containing protein [Thermoleophilia bacterium]